MNDIQIFWLQFQAEMGGSNPTVQAIRRVAFYRGAEMMRDHLNTIERLGDEIAAQDQAGLALVYDSDRDKPDDFDLK